MKKLVKTMQMKLGMRCKLLCALLLFQITTGLAQSKVKDSRMDWWREAKFGLFIHWGLYAVPAGEYQGNTNYGEWIMNEANIPIPEYEKFAARFNPQQFNAAEWVRLAKNAGMKYIVITSKHHDGFCLWDSQVSDYDVMDRTPFKRDILKELSDACKKEGIVFCMYHSIMDWHHPDENKANIDKYREEYLKPQLKELVTRYDPGVLWFDGEWIDEWTTDQGDSLYNWMRQLKPSLIINNRVSKGRNGMQGMNKSKAAGDFGTPEQEILNTRSELDWESCMTMNDHWGYCKNDHNWKSAAQLIWNLVDIVAKGGNYLLNIGPTADGVFPDTSIQRLRELGDWMKVNQEAIYGMKPWNYYEQGDNIRFAQNKKGEVMAYCNGWPGEKLLLRKIKPSKGSTIRLLGSNQQVNWKQTQEGLLVTLPPALQNESKRPTRYVYVFKLKGTPEKLSAAPQIGTSEESKAKMKVIATTNEQVSISAPEKNAAIHFTTDGTTPSLQSATYRQPIPVSKSGLIKAISYVPGKMPSDVSELKLVKGKYAIQLIHPAASQYAAMGPLTLVDGFSADPKDFHRDWLGFEGQNLEAIIDFGAARSFHKVSGSFLRNHASWIFLPVKWVVYTSDDGRDFTWLGEVSESLPLQQEETTHRVIGLEKTATARYIKVVAESIGICPSWHPGNGGKAWIFADEVSVE